MWRKLTSLLFEEEEIVLEEEELKVEPVKIKPVLPMKDKKLEKPEPEPLPSYDTIELEVVEKAIETPTSLEADKPKRSMMIDLEEKTEVEPEVHKPRIFETKKTKESYKRRAILSPMHRGDESEKDEMIQTPAPKPAQKHEPITKIISPMYGSLQDENKNEDAFEEELLDLDLKSMIYEDDNDDEVQTSLYDFLEGLEHEDK